MSDQTIRAEKSNLARLSRRERQIMDIIYRLGQAAVTDVMDEMGEELGNSTVRKQLNILEEKGFLQHITEKNHNIYLPTIQHDSARDSAIKHLLRTFFDGSVSRAMVALLDVSDGQLSAGDKQQLADMIEKTREEGR